MEKGYEILEHIKALIDLGVDDVEIGKNRVSVNFGTYKEIFGEDVKPWKAVQDFSGVTLFFRDFVDEVMFVADTTNRRKQGLPEMLKQRVQRETDGQIIEDLYRQIEKDRNR